MDKSIFPIKLDPDLDRISDLDQIDADRIAIDSALKVAMDRAADNYSKVQLRAQRWWAALIERHNFDDTTGIIVNRKSSGYVLELAPGQESLGTLAKNMFGRRA